MPRGIKKQKEGMVVAMDIGTSNSSVAIITSDGHSECLPDPDGAILTPTVIALPGGDMAKLMFGRSAQNYEKAHPEEVCRLAKRGLGAGGAVMLVTKDGRPLTAEDCQSLFVQWRLRHVEEFTGKKIRVLLGTVPACFTNPQRQATIRIFEQAGVVCLGTLNEPTGALLWSAHGENGTWLVLDLGGGTSDCTLACVENGDTFIVLSSRGVDDLAGNEFTARLMRPCHEEMAQKGKTLDPERDRRDLVLLRQACEDGKLELSSQEETTLVWRAGAELFERIITRTEFAALTADLVDAILALVQETLGAARMTPSQVDGVILVGGSSRIPAIRQAVENLFGAEKLIRDVDVDKAVVLGATRAIGSKIIEKAATGEYALPDDLPDYVLDSTVTIVDVLSQTLGVRAENKRTGERVLYPVVEANTPLPHTSTKTFGLKEGSAKATVAVLQGEPFSPAEQARILDEFPMLGLPAGPAADRIEITFAVNTDGLVDLRAVDRHSGMEIKGQVDASGSIQHSPQG